MKAPASVTAHSGKKIIVIQYLRGLAAVLVVYFHSTGMGAVAPYLTQFRFGDFGVNIFFVISGFVMWSTTDGTDRSTLSFWKARVSRIVPIYWLATAIFVVGAYLLPSSLLNERVFDPAHIVRSLLFIPSFDQSVGAIAPVYLIGWSLNFEMLFYFVFGLGLLFNDAFQRAAFVSGSLAVIYVLASFSSPESAFGFYFNFSLFEFIAGLLLGVARFRLLKAHTFVGLILVASGIAIIAAAQSLTHMSWTLGIGCTSLVAGTLPLEKFASKYPFPICLLLGEASYSVYLFHPFFQRALFLALGGSIASYNQAVLYAVSALIVGTVGGVLVYLTIERWVTIKLRSVT